MAKSISAEELQLRKRARRRLIGAIALVTIVAVFLPMALDHEPKPLSQDISIQIPSPGSGAFTSKIVPVPGAKPIAKSAPPAQSAAPAKQDAPQTAPARAANLAADAPYASSAATATPKKPATGQSGAQTKPAAKLPAKSASASAGKQGRPHDGGAGAYVVQVAALKDADKAKQMQEKIAAAGVKSYTEVVPTKIGNVTRVRAGPFASRNEAQEALDKLKRLGLNGNLVPK